MSPYQPAAPITVAGAIVKCGDAPRWRPAGTWTPDRLELLARAWCGPLAGVITGFNW
jgi:hypothetical protein